MNTIVYCIGITCSGKNYFINECQKRRPDLIGSINVGDEMRRRYKPSYFNGLGAMNSTEKEVWEIYNKQLSDNVIAGKEIILVNGQPRMKSQIEKCIELSFEKGFGNLFLWFNEDTLEIHNRINTRFAEDPMSKALAYERVHNDTLQLYDVIYELVPSCYKLLCVNQNNFYHGLNEVLDLCENEHSTLQCKL